MIRKSAARLLKISPTPDSGAAKVSQTPKRRRNFVFKEHTDSYTAAAAAKDSKLGAGMPLDSSSSISGNRGDAHFIPVARGAGGKAGIARGLRDGEADGAFTMASQRERHWQQVRREEELEAQRRGHIPGAALAPLPSKYGFYGGIDEHGYEAARPTKEDRRRLLQSSLEQQAVSAVEFTDGGERDIDLGGLPESEYHGSAGWTTIPGDSALFNSVYSRAALESRQRANSWTVAAHRQQQQQQQQRGAVIGGELTTQVAREKAASAGDGSGETLSQARRMLHGGDSGGATDAAGELMEPLQESIGAPRSTYGLRKLFVSGLVGYQSVVSREEESLICEELLHLLQDPRAAYVAEETRYCVNLYEEELGIPGKDTLAFGIDRAPTLQRVLYRLFFLGLIPSPPNVCQVSEMIGNFSGYPVHRKPPSVGAYFGLLNLISPTVIHMQHRDAPWYPRLHASPRSLFVFEEPCLSEYAVGYKRTHQPFHAFEYATRVSKDYRIEVLFATVETEQSRNLHDAVRLTAYAKSTAAAATAITDGKEDSPLTGPTDKWLERMRAKIHAARSAPDAESTSAAATSKVSPIDGHQLRKQLLEAGVVSQRHRSLHSEGDRAEEKGTAAEEGRDNNKKEAKSASARRIEALRARYEVAQRLKQRETPSQRSNDGPRVLRGVSPKDKRR